MDIAEAFTSEAIEATDVNVGDEQEDELRGVIRQIYEANQMDVPNKPEESVAVLCFVAGRAYQTEYRDFAVRMSKDLAVEFMEFLVQRGGS